MKNIFAGLGALASCSQILCIFCCVVPTATGILALLTSFGLVGANSHFLGDLSLMFHPYREAILIVSVCLIALSWGLHFYMKKQEASSCGCSIKAKKTPIFLSAATFLLVINIGVMAVSH